MASGNIIAFNGANIIQTAQGVPSGAVQASGAIPNPQYGAQPVGMSTSAPQQVPQKGRLEKFLNAEIKVLGAVQIMIGLIHIGFAAPAICLSAAGYFVLSGAYSFWGGLLFISSGSLCVAGANRPNNSLVKCSLGMNITSAIVASFGILQYIIELSISGSSSLNNNSPENYWKMTVGICLSSVLFLFRLLELFITVSLAHFGCQATCCANDQATMVYVPYQVDGYAALATAPSSSSPPVYGNVVTKPE
ncbi:membrane-spanning 4-domains subfamily A member 8-like isoform 1-T1 [Vipera latastei]